mmetsp:Transcript_3696/g.7130  ORF Transcript_3696/g.7130 Transcript_3696/m.7130 type:complete len:222 (+) Transcript_3696:146-811(+)
MATTAHGLVPWLSRSWPPLPFACSFPLACSLLLRSSNGALLPAIASSKKANSGFTAQAGVKRLRRRRRQASKRTGQLRRRRRARKLRTRAHSSIDFRKASFPLNVNLNVPAGSWMHHLPPSLCHPAPTLPTRFANEVLGGNPAMENGTDPTWAPRLSSPKNGVELFKLRRRSPKTPSCELSPPTLPLSPPKLVRQRANALTTRQPPLRLCRLCLSLLFHLR